MIDNEDIINEINLWNNEFKLGTKINDKLYEIAIFKIFVKFELFLSKMFVLYSTGKASSMGYIPKRKLLFIDEQHLNYILNDKNKGYINYIEKIKTISEHIFEDNKNPFDLIFQDSNYYNYFNQIQAIRNYIAHESQESRKKYIKSVLNNKDFIEPYIHLKKINRKFSKSYYSLYVEKIKEMSEIIIDPSEYLDDTEPLPKEKQIITNKSMDIIS